jgi:cell division protein ZapE
MTTVIARFERLIAAGELKPDLDQRKVAERLDQLAHALEDQPTKGSVLWRMLGRRPDPVRGVYLWGGVGRGKTMLMDLLYDCAHVRLKRRVHFHEFMIDVHDRLRFERAKEVGDPIPPVAAAIAAEAKLLAYDEMVINNTADAAIMSRLFTAIIDAGTTVVATSNRPPRDLYKDGLNRDLFFPFIALIEQKLDVISLNEPSDYRLDRLAGFPTWYTPLGDAATQAVSAAFFRLTDYPPSDRIHVPSCELKVPGGRTLHVPKSLKGVGVFSFKRLCGEPRGAPDYLAIARAFHTVIIVGIPIMGPDRRDQAARFKVLIAALYEHKVKLLAAAAADPQDLYAAGDGLFEFERTVSRLMEMQSADYLAEGHGIAAD